MLGRFSAFGLLVALLGLPFAYMMTTSQDRASSLIAFGGYFVASSLIGNWYVFFGKRFDAVTFRRWLMLNALAWIVVAIGYVAILTRNFQDSLGSVMKLLE